MGVLICFTMFLGLGCPCPVNYDISAYGVSTAKFKFLRFLHKSDLKGVEPGPPTSSSSSDWKSIKAMRRDMTLDEVKADLLAPLPVSNPGLQRAETSYWNKVIIAGNKGGDIVINVWIISLNVCLIERTVCTHTRRATEKALTGSARARITIYNRPRPDSSGRSPGAVAVDWAPECTCVALNGLIQILLGASVDGCASATCFGGSRPIFMNSGLLTWATVWKLSPSCMSGASFTWPEIAVWHQK